MPIASKLLTNIKQIIIVLLASSGILIVKITPIRLGVIMLIALNIICTYVFHAHITLAFSIGFFISMFLVRYYLLFGMFLNPKTPQYWINRLGENKAYQYYEALTAFLFFYRSTSFQFLVETTANTLHIPEEWKTLMQVLSWGMMTVAMVVNVWATLIVGIDVYYYKDMFVGKALGNFEIKGPFKHFSNPMYGIGQFNAYGVALLAGSFWGLMATLLNQITMYLFYYLCEKPHIERIFSQKPVEKEALLYEVEEAV